MFSIARTASMSMNMNPSTGFGASGLYDVQLSFALSEFRVYLGGTFYTNAATPSSSEFTALFDMYSLDRVEVTIFYSNNSSGMGTPAYAMPVFYVVPDYDSVDATTLTAIQQYPSVVSHYLGESGGRPIRITIRPRPTLIGGDGTSLITALTSPAWLNCGTPNLPHFGLKMVWDTVGRTTNIDVGTLNISVKSFFRFKAPR